jgi:hypothetical protein
MVDPSGVLRRLPPSATDVRDHSLGSGLGLRETAYALIEGRLSGSSLDQDASLSHLTVTARPCAMDRFGARMDGEAGKTRVCPDATGPGRQGRSNGLAAVCGLCQRRCPAACKISCGSCNKYASGARWSTRSPGMTSRRYTMRRPRFSRFLRCLGCTADISAPTSNSGPTTFSQRCGRRRADRNGPRPFLPAFTPRASGNGVDATRLLRHLPRPVCHPWAPPAMSGFPDRGLTTVSAEITLLPSSAGHGRLPRPRRDDRARPSQPISSFIQFRRYTQKRVVREVVRCSAATDTSSRYVTPSHANDGDLHRSTTRSWLTAIAAVRQYVFAGDQIRS